jgi:hypothetical protein
MKKFNMEDKDYRAKAIGHLTDALNSVIMAQQALSKSGLIIRFNQHNEIAIAEDALKNAIQKTKGE